MSLIFDFTFFLPDISPSTLIFIFTTPPSASDNFKPKFALASFSDRKWTFFLVSKFFFWYFPKLLFEKIKRGKASTRQKKPQKGNYFSGSRSRQNISAPASLLFSGARSSGSFFCYFYFILFYLRNLNSNFEIPVFFWKCFS